MINFKIIFLPLKTELKKSIKLIVVSITFICFLTAKAEEEKEKNHFIIESEASLKTTDFITSKLQEIKIENRKLESDILLLQDKLISKSKDKIDLNIYLTVSNQIDGPHYGVIQMTGILNNIPLIQYDHPLVFEKNEKFPLFEGPLPLGAYEFKISAIVGQRPENWPFILPEGKWNVDKTISIDSDTLGGRQSIQIILQADKATGIPQFEVKNEEIKP